MGRVPTFLVEHSELVPVALLLVVLGCAALGWVTRSRPRTLGWLLGLSLVPVLGLTLAPDGRGRVQDVRCEVVLSLPGLGSNEMLANIALFVPPAVLAVVLWRRPVLVAVGGSLLSAGIEGVQALAVVLGRSCATNDWAMNTVGTLVGVAAGSAVLAVGRVTARG